MLLQVVFWDPNDVVQSQLACLQYIKIGYVFIKEKRSIPVVNHRKHLSTTIDRFWLWGCVSLRVISVSLDTWTIYIKRSLRYIKRSLGYIKRSLGYIKRSLRYIKRSLGYIKGHLIYIRISKQTVSLPCHFVSLLAHFALFFHPEAYLPIWPRTLGIGVPTIYQSFYHRSS